MRKMRPLQRTIYSTLQALIRATRDFRINTSYFWMLGGLGKVLPMLLRTTFCHLMHQLVIPWVWASYWDKRISHSCRKPEGNFPMRLDIKWRNWRWPSVSRQNSVSSESKARRTIQFLTCQMRNTRTTCKVPTYLMQESDSQEIIKINCFLAFRHQIWLVQG